MRWPVLFNEKTRLFSYQHMLFPRRKPHTRGVAGPFNICVGARYPGAAGNHNLYVVCCMLFRNKTARSGCFFTCLQLPNCAERCRCSV